MKVEVDDDVIRGGPFEPPAPDATWNQVDEIERVLRDTLRRAVDVMMRAG